VARDAVKLLLIAGRSGVGKSCVAFEVSDQLRTAGVAHCLVDGDNLDAAYPKPDDDPNGTFLTETNLHAIWQTYAMAGYQRMLYVNTVSVLEADMVVRAVGGDAHVTGVVLTATDDVASERLARREIGGALSVHLQRSAAAAERLDAFAPAWVRRVATDGRTVPDIAASVIAATGWVED
jgi:Adenylylsulphate kinase